MTIFYKFSFNNESYIGSTNYPLSNRIAEHRMCVSRIRCRNIKFYKYCYENNIREIMENYFEVLEDCKKTLNDLDRRKREQYWMDLHNPTLNMRKAYGWKTTTRTRTITNESLESSDNSDNSESDESN